MKDAAKKFLSEEPKRLGSSERGQIFLIGFGKHPAWNDYIETAGGAPFVGEASESLTIAEDILKSGILNQAAAWEQLEKTAPEKLNREFKHVFCWHRKDQFIVGRMWSSRDGAGQPRRFPMIVAAHCAGMPLEAALAAVLPRLEDVEAACKSVSSAAEVESVITSALRDLRGQLPSLSAQAQGQIQIDREAFIRHSDWGPQHQGLERVIHHIRGQMSAFERFSKGDTATFRPQHIRVPVCGASPDAAIVLWNHFLRLHASDAIPLLLVVPPRGEWLDVIVGLPSGREFYYLCATLQGSALATTIPYEIEQEDKVAAQAALKAFGVAPAPVPPAAPRAASPSPKPVKTTPDSGSAPARRSLFQRASVKSVLGGMVVLATWALWLSNRKPPSPPAVANSGTRAPAIVPAKRDPEPLPAAKTTLVKQPEAPPASSEPAVKSEPPAPPPPPPNSPPTFAVVGPRQLEAGKSSSLAIGLADDLTPPERLHLWFESSDPNLLPTNNLSPKVSGTNLLLALLPVRPGTVTIALWAEDAHQQKASNRLSFTVLASNRPPQIASIADQKLASGEQRELAVALFDDRTVTGQLRVGLESSDSSLLAATPPRISGPNVVLSLAPIRGRSGEASINLWVEDAEGLRSNSRFKVIVAQPAPPPEVATAPTPAPDTAPKNTVGAALPEKNVAPENPPLWIERIEDRTLAGTNAINVPVQVRHKEPSRQISLKATSTDETKLPNGALRTLGFANEWVVKVIPGGAQPGSTRIRLVASDGSLNVTSYFAVTIK